MVRRRRRAAGPARPPSTISPRCRSSASRTRTWPHRAPRGRRPACEALVDAAGPVPVHMDGARLFNAEVATGRPGGRVGRARHDRHVLPVEGPLRAGGLAAGGERGRDRRGSPGPQAPRRGHAPGRRAGGAGPAGLARHGRPAARGPRAGGAAGGRGGARAGPTAGSTRRRCARTSWPSPTPNRRSSWPTWRVTGCWPTPSRPGRSASSRTMTSTTQASTRAIAALEDAP